MPTKQIAQQIGRIIAELETIRKRLSVDAKETAKFPISRMSLIDDRICLECGKPISEDEKETRKVHYRCYKQLTELVKRGSSWDELISEGRCYFAGSGGRPTGRKSSDQSAGNKEVPEKLSTKKKPDSR